MAHWLDKIVLQFSEIPGPQPVGRGYSGIHYGAAKILYWGGGHQGYPGNDPAVFDCGTNRWDTSLYIPEWPGEFPGDMTSAKALREGGPAVYSGSGSPILSVTGKPFVCHTYQQIRYYPPYRGFMVLHRPAGVFMLRPWRWKPWERLAHWSGGGGVETHALLDYSDGQLFAAISGGEATGMYRWRHDKQGWDWTGFLPARDWTDFYSAQLGDGNHLVRAWGRWWVFSQILGWVPLLSEPALDSFCAIGRGQVLGLKHSAPEQVRGFIWTRATLWREVQVQGDVPRGRDGVQAAAPMVAWDTLYDRAIFLNARTHEGGFQGGSTQTYQIKITGRRS